jgi:hypothetical protein
MRQEASEWNTREMVGGKGGLGIVEDSSTSIRRRRVK